MNNQERIAHRARYMAKEITFQQHYLELAKQLNVRDDDLGAGWIGRIADAGRSDVIDLCHWDRRHFMIEARAFKLGWAWSMSDTVCTLKAYAEDRAFNEQPVLM